MQLWHGATIAPKVCPTLGRDQFEYYLNQNLIVAYLGTFNWKKKNRNE